MKAVVYNEYGAPDVLHLQDVETPAPKDNEIRVKIRSSTVNVGDLWARNFKSIAPRDFSMPLPLWLPARLYFGISKPKVKILGSEFAGDVDAVGNQVTSFKLGDAVFGYCGQSMGTYAEYRCISANGLVTQKPANMDYAQAAAIPYGALTAMTLLRRVNIQPGQNVLINGASGSIGAAAVQLAKAYGATVTGVCGTPRVEYVKALGADQVIDSTKTDFTKNGARYDLIFDILRKSSFARVQNSLTPKGIYLLASFKTKQLLQMLQTRNKFPKVICALSNETPQDLRVLRELAEAGKLRAIIDRSFPLAQAADAHRYVETGEKRGSVIITMNATSNV